MAVLKKGLWILEKIRHVCNILWSRHHTSGYKSLESPSGWKPVLRIVSLPSHLTHPCMSTIILALLLSDRDVLLARRISGYQDPATGNKLNLCCSGGTVGWGFMAVFVYKILNLWSGVLVDIDLLTCRWKAAKSLRCCEEEKKFKIKETEDAFIFWR